MKHLRTMVGAGILLLASCVSTGPDFNFADAERITIGMTREQVTEILGAPNNTQIDLSGELWMWIHVRGGISGYHSKGFAVKMKNGRVVQIQKKT